MTRPRHPDEVAERLPTWHIPKAKNGYRWGDCPDFVAWFKSVAPTMSAPELAKAISERTDAVGIRPVHVNGLKRTHGLHETPLTRQKAFDSRAHVNPTPSRIRLLGPADEDFFVKVTGDAIVASDWHCPYHSEAVVTKMLEVAKTLKISQLIINGDFLNQDAFSKWKGHPFNVGWPVERDIATMLLEDLCKVFTRIFYILDNHDRRLIAMHEKPSEFTEHDLLKLLIKGTWADQIRASVYYHHVTVNGKWLVASPKEYRRQKLALPNRLAQVYHSHVISGGDHLFGLGFDDSAKYVIANNMCVVNQQEVPYPNVQLSTYPHWNRGFYAIKGDVLMPFVFHENLWPTWLEWLDRRKVPNGAAPR